MSQNGKIALNFLPDFRRARDPTRIDMSVEIGPSVFEILKLKV